MNSAESPGGTKSRRSKWRFTLRELLLAIIAAGAIFALFAQSRPFRTTPFLDGFDERELLESASKSSEMQFGAQTSSESSSRVGNHCIRDFDLSMKSPPPADAGRALVELQREIKAQLSKCGCRLTGSGTSGDPSSKTLQSFEFSYRKSNTRGIIKVDSFVSHPNQWRLKILILEF